MKVLVVNDGLEHRTHSVPRLAVQLARHLAAAGHDVRLVGTVETEAERPATAGTVGDGVGVVALPTAYPRRWRSYLGLHNPRVIPAFRRLVADLRPDLVHFHNVHSAISYWALRVARQGGAKVVLTSHDVMPFWPGKLACFDAATTLDDVTTGRIGYRRSELQVLAAERLRYFPLHRPLVRWLVGNHVDRLVAVSHEHRRALAQNGFPGAVTIHSGVDPEAFEIDASAAAEFARRHPLEGEKVILFGGRLGDLKGIEPLLAALARLSTSLSYRLLVIGGGTAATEALLDRRAEELGIADRVVRTGWLHGAELAAAYAAADVAVNPSLCFETLSLFNLEAAAAGKPVVSTFFGGAAETVIDGESGLLVNPYDVAALAATIGGLLADPGRARAMGARGRRMVGERFHAIDRLRDVEELHAAL